MSSKRKRKKRASGGLPRGLQRSRGWLIAGALAAVAGAAVAFLMLAGGSESDGGSGGSPLTPTPDPRVAGATPAAVISIETDDEGQQVNPRFVPNTIEGKAGEVLEIDIRNVGTVAHNLRVSGTDKEYDTRDDFASTAVKPGDQRELLLKIDDPGSYPFRCDFHPQQTGTLVLR